MVKTHKQLMAEIMEREREKEERRLEFEERIRQIEEKKNKGKKHVIKEPEIIGYLNTKKKGEVNFYGVVSKEIKAHKGEKESKKNEVIEEKKDTTKLTKALSVEEKEVVKDKEDDIYTRKLFQEEDSI